MELYPHQEEALKQLHSGSILCGSTGSGKSLTGLEFYYRNFKDLPLYIITTARKRDTREWELELHKTSIFSEVTVDSWNNIEKYKDVNKAFFIFDEQRVVSYGKWSKTFIKIAKANKWILLSATPGDTWMDYMPVFIANGFYKNRTDFIRQHVEYVAFSTYPKISRYINTGILMRHRLDVLVMMYLNKPREVKEETITCWYNKELYLDVFKERWNIYKNVPIASASETCQTLRRVVNSDPSRLEVIKNILMTHEKVIIFYNYDYELDILRNGLKDYNVAEWNGHKHQPIPTEKDSWVYLVQYTAGAEGWNCIETDTIIFYSYNYSYKIMEQAKGRIDRLNSPWSILYYFYLSSESKIDANILKALTLKETFNESIFIKKINLGGEP